jgi:hypothetical protein
VEENLKQEIKDLLDKISDDDLETLNYIQIIIDDILKEME